MDTPQYQERVKKKILNQSQPKIEPLKPLDENPTDPLTEADSSLQHIGSSLTYWLWFLGLSILAIISFSLVEAYLTVVNLLQEHWLLGLGLGSLLLGLVIASLLLITQETKGLIRLKAITHKRQTIKELQAIGDKDITLAALAKTYSKTDPNSPASKHYRLFLETIKPHHTHDETLKIFKDTFQDPLLNQARTVLRTENISAGAISFFSPNSLLQTLGILWISLRTLKKVAFVYGLRPSLMSNLRLFRIALENLAATSLTNLVTDEVANQLGGSLSDKVIANSADAITAAALNQRLGKALIRSLSS